MKFDPLKSSEKIVEDFRRYILTTFKTNDSLINEQLQKLINSDTISNGPFLSVAPNYLKECTLKSLIPNTLSIGFEKIPESSLKPEKFILYRHQLEAIDTVVKKDHNLVLSTGTGSGKTMSFLLPTINHLLDEREKGTLSDGVRAMIIYPMNALANDQMNVLRNLLKDTGITFGSFTGETETFQDKALKEYQNAFNHDPEPNELISREVMNKRPPNILITNYAMLERLLILPDHKELFGAPGKNHWKYIILDEAHMYSGAKGSEVSALIRRLKETVSNNNIRFLLTSATLGEKEDDDLVVDFANKLCGTGESDCPFVKSDVIRSTTFDHEKPDEIKEIDDSFFEDISECISDGRNKEEVEENIVDYLDEKYPGSGNYSSRIFDIVCVDSRIYELKEYLSEDSRSVSEICRYMEMESDKLIRFIQTISLAEKDGYKLFDSRYHMFIKNVEGLYSTLTSDPHVFIHKCTTFNNTATNKEERVFELSACNNCGQIYLIGKHENEKLIQNAVNEGVIKDSVFMVIGHDDFDEEDYTDEELLENIFELCTICGSLSHYGSGNPPCDHDEHRYLYRIKEGDTKVCTCKNCGQTENRRGMLRHMYLGYDSSTAVIASSLYGEMSDNADSRFLSFSDNRQNAAYFASYLESTHQNLILHAAMYHAIIENEQKLITSGMSVEALHDHIESIIVQNEIYSKVYNGGDTTACSDAWAILYIDMAKYNSNKSFEYLGQIYYEYIHKPLKIEGLSENETSELINQIVKIARDKIDINRPTALKPDIWKKYYQDHNPGFIVCKTSDRRNKEDYLVTKRIKNYLELVTGSSDGYAIGKKILKLLELAPAPKNGYYVDYHKLKVRKKNHTYRCTKCLKCTPFNVKDYCYHCGTQTLEKIDTTEMDITNSYAYNYANMPLKALHIKEHTAQLNRTQARDYQNKFKNNEIDALSCSTTFEVGVDIGNLNTVLLRNMPPTPANYIQRVGRAGRSPESSAYSLTYCKNTPHDINYFHNPLNMIQGKVPVPSIKEDNIRIAIRHIFASALAFYWRQSGKPYPRTISEFMEEYEHLETYLKSKPSNLLDYLKSTVPKSIQNHISTDIETDLTIDLENYGWLEELLDDKRGRLKQCKLEYELDIESINKYEEMKGMKFKKVREMITDENTIEYLSRHNVIPKYGFPSEIVELINQDPYNTDLNVKLQRDLTRAISEYAPDSEVIADGYVVKSKYLKKIPSKDWPKYYYIECQKCNSVNIQLYTGQTMDEFRESIDVCPRCLSKYQSKRVQEFIIPRYGFLYEADENWDIVSKKPTHSYSGEVFYRGNNSSKLKKCNIEGHNIYCAYGRDDELVLINRTNFKICSLCGYGTTSNHIREHMDNMGKDCKGTLYANNLGHVFKTDVFIIDLLDCNIYKIDQALSILSALINSFCSIFQIDENEISGCISRLDERFVFVLYDNTPGGAGYVKGALADNDETILKLLRKSLELSKNCTCGNENDTECACYGCLLNYRNQRHHDKIKRKHVIDALSRYEE